MKKNKQKKAVVEVGRTGSLIILFIWGCLMLVGFYYFAVHMNWIGFEETTTIQCANGDVELWNGSGVYCGIYVEDLRTLEKEITSREDLDFDYGLSIQ